MTLKNTYEAITENKPILIQLAMALVGIAVELLTGPAIITLLYYIVPSVLLICIALSDKRNNLLEKQITDQENHENEIIAELKNENKYLKIQSSTDREKILLLNQITYRNNNTIGQQQKHIKQLKYEKIEQQYHTPQANNTNECNASNNINSLFQKSYSTFKCPEVKRLNPLTTNKLEESTIESSFTQNITDRQKVVAKLRNEEISKNYDINNISPKIEKTFSDVFSILSKNDKKTLVRLLERVGLQMESLISQSEGKVFVVATINEHFDIAVKLLEAGDNVHAKPIHKTSDNYSYFAQVAELGCKPSVSFLLRHGANRFVSDVPERALKLAIENNKTEIVDILLQYSPYDPTKDLITLTHIASFLCTPILKVFMNHYPYPEEELIQALEGAISNNKDDNIQLLLLSMNTTSVKKALSSIINILRVETINIVQETLKKISIKGNESCDTDVAETLLLQQKIEEMQIALQPRQFIYDISTLPPPLDVSSVAVHATHEFFKPNINTNPLIEKNSEEAHKCLLIDGNEILATSMLANKF